MAPDRLRATLTALPFRPFVAEIAGGKRVAIDHPDYASLSPSGRTLIVYGYPKDDSMEIVDVSLLANFSVKGGSEATAA
jgi:hypothetical protein